MADAPESSSGADPGEPSLWQSRQVATAVLAGAIFIAASIAAVGLEEDPPRQAPVAATTTSSSSSSTSTPDTVPTGGTSSTTAGDTTSTTGPTPVTFAPPSTSPPTSSPTTVASSSACGSGNVVAQPIPGDVTSNNGSYSMPVSARVRSEFDRDIEVTSLVLTVAFQDGSTRDVPVDASGVSIAPGAVVTFSGGTVTSSSPPTSVDLTTLAFQPVGRSDCQVSQ